MKKRGRIVSPPVSVLRLQTILHGMRKKRPQSVKLKSSQSDTDRPRKNSGKGCHQTDTLLGKMKITQKRGGIVSPQVFSFKTTKYITRNAQRASAVCEIKIKSIG